MKTKRWFPLLLLLLVWVSCKDCKLSVPPPPPECPSRVPCNEDGTCPPSFPSVCVERCCVVNTGVPK